MGCSEGKRRDAVPPSSPALGWWLTGHMGLHCIQLAVGGLIAGLQPSLMGRMGNQVFFLRLLVPPCYAIPAEPQDLLRKPRAALAQNQGGGKQMIAFAKSNLQHSPKQADNLFYFHFMGRGGKKKKRLTSDVTSITTKTPLACLPLPFTLPASPFSP